MKRVFISLLFVLSLFSVNLFADVFADNSSEANQSSIEASQPSESDVDNIPTVVPASNQENFGSNSSVSGVSQQSMTIVNIIRDARIQGIEFAEKANDAKNSQKPELATAYLNCSGAFNEIAEGYENRNNEKIKQGRIDYQKSKEEINRLTGKSSTKRMRNPAFTLETTRTD